MWSILGLTLLIVANLLFQTINLAVFSTNKF